MAPTTKPPQCRSKAFLPGWDAGERCTLERDHPYACVGTVHWWYPLGAAGLTTGRLADVSVAMQTVDEQLLAIASSLLDPDDVEDNEMQHRYAPPNDLEIVTALLAGVAFTLLARRILRGRWRGGHYLPPACGLTVVPIAQIAPPRRKVQ